MKQAKTNTMKAVAIDRFGGPETLTLETLPVPEVWPDEVLIRVESADVAVWDPSEREGGFAKLCGIKPRFPHALGTDGAGTVAAVGNSVARFKQRDRVYGVALMNSKGGVNHQLGSSLSSTCQGEPVEPILKTLRTERVRPLFRCPKRATNGV
jgi:NADPH:quinone reductase-like Zn-dependent oxidoreductase